MLGEAAAAQVLTHGGAWVGRERVQEAARPLLIDDEVALSRPPSGVYAEVTIDPRWILYEDADLLALDKPPGLYVEATPWDLAGNLRVALAAFLAQRGGTAHALHLAHRLDRDTSGVLLFSKSPEVNPALQRSFAGGLVQKMYLCRCVGVPNQSIATIATGHGRGARGQFRVYPLDELGRALPAGGGTVKLMQTRITVLERGWEAALVQAEPITGRTHQIRLHLAHIGHPLLGDTRYGGPSRWGQHDLSYHLLHAARLSLPHPRSGVPMTIQANDVWWTRDYPASASGAA
ncbi:MAG: RluA family pseudouridine synthase [Roseiflexaceae bacterium]|nr:RluA family pseudouridine synthase [Roseiflexaceae bacterium]